MCHIIDTLQITTEQRIPTIHCRAASHVWVKKFTFENGHWNIWSPVSVMVYLPFSASYWLFESKYNKNDKGSHFGLEPNNSRSKTRQNSRHKSQQKDLRKKVSQKVDKKLDIKVDKILGNKVGRKVDMRPEKGRETMALTGLRRNGITRRAY